MSNINKIRLSGQTYNIQDLNATKTVELTQAEYDALSQKDPNVFYIITDAKGADLSNYYTKSETSGATEISTALNAKADTATTYTKTETDNAITAATSTKQDTLVSGTNIKTINNQSIIGEGNIEIQGGSGGESCTVDSNTIFYSFSRKYSNNELDMRVRYVVLDYGQHKTDTPNVSINVNFRDANYNTYVSQNINLDYSTSSYTLGDISQAEYIDVTYDSTINDFKIAVATAYTSTVFIDYINFWEGKIKVPFYTISSGSPCTVIENDIPTAISELSESMLKGLGRVNIITQQDAISIYTDKLNGDGISSKIKLDEIDGSNSTLKPDIYVGLGTSGWTEINLSKQCDVDSLKATKYRVTYNYSEFDANSMGLQLIVEYAVNLRYDYVNFDKTQQPSLQTSPSFSAATVDWNASTKELVITYPETVELNGKQESVKISQIHSNNCQFGQAITKLESYGEEKQALKSYVKETRDALGGKQDTLVSGTNIKTINGETLLGEGNITIQGGSGGGKAIEAGTNISVTTGETADTINCTLPIREGSNSNGKGIIIGDSECSSTGQYSISIGHSAGAGGPYSLCMGSNSHCNGQQSIVIGDGSSNNGSDFTYCFGRSLHPNRVHQFLGGAYLNSNNEYEVAFGQYNVSSKSKNDYGDSGNTLFSIGNGYDFSSTHNRHNALEIRQNGDIYIANTNDTSITGDKAYSLYPMIKLQDTITATAENTTALGGLKLVKLTQSEYDSLSTKDNSTLYLIVN